MNILEPTFKGTNESVDINDHLEENLIIPLNGMSWGVVVEKTDHLTTSCRFRLTRQQLWYSDV